jgi:hypothetical protein
MADVGYSGIPLARKLGVKPGARVLMTGAPAGFMIPDLPPGVAVDGWAGREPDDRELGDRERYDVVLLFATEHAGLSRGFVASVGRLVAAGALWACWPKRAAVRAGLAVSDLDDYQVRAAGLAAGLVDTKVAAVDEVWSALRFVRRVADR